MHRVCTQCGEHGSLCSTCVSPRPPRRRPVPAVPPIPQDLYKMVSKALYRTHVEGKLKSEIIQVGGADMR